jgi:sugar lactone lactonase YvrE
MCRLHRHLAFAALLSMPCLSSGVDTGTITTAAGTGVAGFNGDNIQATAAMLHDPTRVTAAPNGDLYIVDTFNSRIRKVDGAGVITTPVSGVFPFDVARDASGNLFIADIGGSRIARWDAATLALTTAVGGLNLPAGVTLDAQGNLFIAEFGAHRIRRFDASTGVLSTVAGTGVAGLADGPAAGAQFNNPSGVAFDVDGNLLIADFNNHAVRKLDTSGNVSTVAGTGAFGFSGDDGPAIAAWLNFPASVAIGTGKTLFIADFANNRIRRIDCHGTISTFAGNGVIGSGGDNGPATSANLGTPQGVAVDSLGNVFIGDRANNRVRKVTPSGGATLTGCEVETTVEVSLPGGGTASADVSFEDVAAAGTTTVTASDQGPALPSGFQLGDPPVYYDVATDATFNGAVTLCFGWQDGQFSNPDSIKLLHYENGWQDVTTSLDTTKRIVCGRTSSLSPFALVQFAYDFAGFFAPISNLPALNKAKAGSAIPVKFSLGGNQGLHVFAPGYPAAQVVACGGNETGDITSTMTAGASGLSYDAASNRYTYVWKTDAAWTGCRQLVLRFNDGSQRVANFQFTK